MLALKTLVAVLGIMIVAAAGLIFYGILTKFSDLNVTSTTNFENFEDHKVEIPLAAKVKDFVVNNNRLVIYLTMPNGLVRFLIVDLETGRVLGSIVLEK